MPDDIELIDIKKNLFTDEELTEMYRLTGSYEALFSKRSQKFISSELKERTTSDADYGKLLPQDYTFLKRPILVYNDQIFIGNNKKTDESIKSFLAKMH